MTEKNLTNIISGINFKIMNNVTDPSITISPIDDTIYLSYAKTENNETNIYLEPIPKLIFCRLSCSKRTVPIQDSFHPSFHTL